MSQAVTTASSMHEGRLVGAELEVDDGRLVYEVEMMTSKGEMEVLVDAGDGHIVADTDDGDDEEEEEEKEEEGESSFLGATVSLGEALKRALEARSGWAVEAELEERNGRLAYFIEVRTQEGRARDCPCRCGFRGGAHHSPALGRSEKAEGATYGRVFCVFTDRSSLRPRCFALCSARGRVERVAIHKDPGRVRD